MEDLFKIRKEIKSWCPDFSLHHNPTKSEKVAFVGSTNGTSDNTQEFAKQGWCCREPPRRGPLPKERGGRKEGKQNTTTKRETHPSLIFFNFFLNRQAKQ